jgi:hypothetical protein
MRMSFERSQETGVGSLTGDVKFCPFNDLCLKLLPIFIHKLKVSQRMQDGREM